MTRNISQATSVKGYFFRFLLIIRIKRNVYGKSIEELAIIEVEPEISLVTVHGSVSSETMRVITKLEGKAVIALLDTGARTTLSILKWFTS